MILEEIYNILKIKKKSLYISCIINIIKMKSLNITIPTDILEEIENLRLKVGINRSEFTTMLIRKGLEVIKNKVIY
jgi:hypothetical protein